jgi:hypothetical protein
VLRDYDQHSETIILSAAKNPRIWWIITLHAKQRIPRFDQDDGLPQRDLELDHAIHHQVG